MAPSILPFGATSIVGFSLVRLFPRTVLPFVTPGSRSRAAHPWPVLNLDNSEWAKALFNRYQPNLLLYCHAVCDVSKCEAAPDWAREINFEYLRRVVNALPRAVSRVERANYLMSLFGQAAKFACESRHQRAVPHLGRVELASVYRGNLFSPLASVIDF